jgi:hypothetical protein
MLQRSITVARGEAAVQDELSSYRCPRTGHSQGVDDLP